MNRINKNIFNNDSYFHYVVQYRGNPKKEIESKFPEFVINIISLRYAILSLPKPYPSYYPILEFETIIYLQPYDVYTLQDISPLEASQANFLQLDLPLNIEGDGVLIAVIDTGIDYLSEEFMDDNGNTRIEYIWDQSSDTIINPNSDLQPPFGAIYTNEDIQKAINLSRDGGDPYSIVPTKDTIGHGTKMSCLIGGSGKNPEYRGVVPKCKYMVIKLVEDKALFKDYLINTNIPVFNGAMLFVALEFIYRYALKNFRPIVVYLPLGASLGSHEGNNILDKLIDNISFISGIVVVTGSGNEANAAGHTSGKLTKEYSIQTIDLDVSPEQKTLFMEIWVTLPDIYSIDIISPSGENTGIINYDIFEFKFFNFIFEKTKVVVTYAVPEESSGMELIRIRFSDLQPGVWKIRVIGNLIVDGTYNAYLPQKGLTVGGTKFNSSSPYNTITNPGNSSFVVTVAAYNQNNDNIANFSGMSSPANSSLLRYGTIDIAAGGINAVTLGPNNERAVVSGTSVAAAIVAGACAMLFDWGIIQGNDPNMFSQSIKSYLARGVSQRSGDIYPNAQWGYGMLNIFNLFKNIT